MSLIYLFVWSGLEALRKHCPLTGLAWPEWISMKDGKEKAKASTAVALRGGLEKWRGSPFLGELYLWANSQAAQSEVVSGLFSYSSTVKDCAALFISFIALLLTVWEVYSHGFYTLVRLKFGERAEITLWHDYFNKECPAAWTNTHVSLLWYSPPSNIFLKVCWGTWPILHWNT